MPDRIAELFARTRREARAALLPYLMLGYPDLETSIAAARAALAAGAEVLATAGSPEKRELLSSLGVARVAD